MEAKRRAFNEMSADTRILINTLELKLIKEQQEFISYEELSAAIGRDVRDGGRNLLQTARRHVESEADIMLTTVCRKGIKRSKEYAGQLRASRKHIGKVARKQEKRVMRAVAADTTIDISTLAEIGAERTIMEMHRLFAKDSSYKKLESSIRANQNRELPTAETLKLFSK